MYTLIRDPGAVTDVRAWITGVEVEREARGQLQQLTTQLPSSILRHPVAIMPDIHFGNGTTVGTVIPTTGALIPNAVGVDIGCGMLAVKTSLKRKDLPETISTTRGVESGGQAVSISESGGGSQSSNSTGNVSFEESFLASLRLSIEVAVPHGRTHNGKLEADAGGWRGVVPTDVSDIWKRHLENGFKRICAKRPKIEQSNNLNHLGTLGTGNHFIEICVEHTSRSPSAPKCGHHLQSQYPDVFGGSSVAEDDGEAPVWVLLHSGSRGVGGKIGSEFIRLAQDDMEKTYGRGSPSIPSNKSLCYLREGTSYFDDYVEAVSWAQEYARYNRELMAKRVIAALRCTRGIRDPKFTCSTQAVNCHHNYVERYPSLVVGKENVWLTRKGATSAKFGELAIIPGSMGAASYIVRGKGNANSYNSCSHGAGRRHSRGETKRRFTAEDHEKATAGIECRKDADVIDETPMAYKDIDAVMAAQSDLVEVVCTLKQIICVKG